MTAQTSDKQQTAGSVLFAGEFASGSSPSGTLARALETCGLSTAFSGRIERRNTRAWLRMTRGASAIVVVTYQISPFFLRQLALAVVAGTPVIRWWVGSDVMETLHDPVTRKYSLMLQRMASRQIAVSPHLVDELKTIGLRADHVPSVLDPGPPPRVLDHVPHRLLVYLPETRRDFYGARIVRQAAEAFPDVEFIIVADNQVYWDDLPNARCLGWVSDLDSIWNQVGGVLRVTKHDGMPRMVLDALRRGKYVLYSWPFPACELTCTFDEVCAGIRDFRRAEKVNLRGIDHFARLMNPLPEQQFADAIASIARGASLRCRVAAAQVAAAQTVDVKLRSRGLRGSGAQIPAQ